jgi:GntR family transcriptional regulator, rspAB operon transcriptional repressor
MKTASTRDGQDVAAVHERLRTAILRGELEGGAVTSQALLARDFDTGRTPLREALRLLQREGLVIAEPNRRVRIAPLSSEDAEGLFTIRIALEAVAIRITVPTLTSDDFAQLEGYMAQMEHYQKVADQAGFRTPHRAFHQLLVAASGPRVSSEIAQLADHSERYRRSVGGSGSWDERRAEHRAILDAAASGDPDLAADRLAAHYVQAAALVFAALNPQHDLTGLRTAIRTVAPGAEAALRKR